MSHDSKDHVFELQRLLAIKDNQLYEDSLIIKSMALDIIKLKIENEDYKTTNFFLREAINTMETRIEGLSKGTSLDYIHEKKEPPT